MKLCSFKKDMNVAVIGASGGIGNQIVEQLARHDSVKTIYALSRSQTSFSSEKVKWLPLDYSQEDSVEAAASQASLSAPLDIVFVATGLLHNDDISPEKSLKEIDTQSFAKAFHVNSTGPALVMKHFLPHMNKDAKSVFCVLSARVGSISDNYLGGWYAYRASKAALNMLIKTASIEIARKNKHVCVAALHPGTVDTQLSEPFQSHVPEGKLFTPEYSSTCLIDVMNNLTHKDSGKIFAWDGQEIAP